MSGKIFAKIEVDWILGSDEHSYKWAGLPPMARCLYVTLWCLAVANRKETIKRPSNAYLGSMAAISHNYVERMMGLCRSMELLSFDNDSITIFHVAKKHPQFNILENHLESNKNESAISELELEQKESKKKKENPPTPRKRGVVSDKPKVESTSDMRNFTDWWCSEFETRFKGKYGFQKKDGIICADLLKRFDLADLKRRAVLFFESTDEWICKAGKTIPIFSSKVNAFAGDFKSDEPNLSKAFTVTADALNRFEEKMLRQQEAKKNGVE